MRAQTEVPFLTIPKAQTHPPHIPPSLSIHHSIATPDDHVCSTANPSGYFKTPHECRGEMGGFLLVFDSSPVHWQYT